MGDRAVNGARHHHCFERRNAQPKGAKIVSPADLEAAFGAALGRDELRQERSPQARRSPRLHPPHTAT